MNRVTYFQYGMISEHRDTIISFDDHLKEQNDLGYKLVTVLALRFAGSQFTLFWELIK